MKSVPGLPARPGDLGVRGGGLHVRGGLRLRLGQGRGRRGRVSRQVGGGHEPGGFFLTICVM